jgi:hypothetical protein
MISVVPQEIRVQMATLDWIYILGWIDAHGVPKDMPLIIIELRTKIQEQVR